MKIFIPLLYLGCLCQFAYLVHESLFIYGFRASMSQYAAFDMEPPLRNIIATSMWYIIASPLAPVLGAMCALKHKCYAPVVLTSSFCLGVVLIIFDFWFEVNLFEGVSFVG